MTTSVSEVVAALGCAIAQRIGEPRYKLWFEPNTKFLWHDGLLTIGVPNHFFQEWLQKTFADAVRAAAAEVFGQPMEVRFVIDGELFRAARRAQEAVLPTAAVEAAPVVPAKATGETPPVAAAPKPRRSRSWKRLEEFIAGACNRVAHAAALSVVEAPGQASNPLVLYGPVGTGKTHLLEGIYVALRKRQPERSVSFTTAEEFTNRFVQAMRLGKVTAFRRHFREREVLLLDDLQFLAGKRATREEFLHTFDAILAAGGQMIFTCDCHPKLADEFPAELVDRLLGGAVWSLVPPDPATRRELLRAKAQRIGLVLSAEVLDLLVEQLHGNVRELEGALHSLVHFSRVTRRRVDPSLAREALGDLLRHSIRRLHLGDIDRVVCQALRLPEDALRSTHRAWAISHARMLAMYLARKYTAATYSEIGMYFGRRNHSTAVAAEKKVRQWLHDRTELTLGDQYGPVHQVLERIERQLHS